MFGSRAGALTHRGRNRLPGPVIIRATANTAVGNHAISPHCTFEQSKIVFDMSCGVPVRVKTQSLLSFIKNKSFVIELHGNREETEMWIEKRCFLKVQ